MPEYARSCQRSSCLSTRQEDVEEIARTGDQILRRMIWFLSSGYSITTLLGYFRPTSQGVFLESELMSAPDRKRLKLGIAYSMSQEMRQALADAEIDVEIQKSVSGPQLFTVVSAQDAQNPEAAARGEGVPISAGQTCIIKGKHIKVGGEGEQIGVTIRRTDGDSGRTFFFPASKLYPNTPTQVGFVLPATAARRLCLGRYTLHAAYQQRFYFAERAPHGNDAGQLCRSEVPVPPVVATGRRSNELSSLLKGKRATRSIGSERVTQK